MRHKFLIAFVLGIVATVFAILFFRMVQPFVDGASEIFFAGMGVGLLLGIVLSVWIVRKIDAPREPDPRA